MLFRSCSPSSVRRSLLPIPKDAKLPLQFSFKLEGNHLRVFLGSVMIREVNGFMHDATPAERAGATCGVMGCSPKNTAGVEVRFQDFHIGWSAGGKGH